MSLAINSQFDIAALREAVANDKDLLRKIIDLFRRTSQENLAELKLAIQNRDGKALAAKAHHLKGSLLELFAKDAVEQVRRLESLGQSALWDELGQQWLALDHSIQKLVLEIDAALLQRSA